MCCYPNSWWCELKTQTTFATQVIYFTYDVRSCPITEQLFNNICIPLRLGSGSDQDACTISSVMHNRRVLSTPSTIHHLHDRAQYATWPSYDWWCIVGPESILCLKIAQYLTHHSWRTAASSNIHNDVVANVHLMKLRTRGNCWILHSTLASNVYIMWNGMVLFIPIMKPFAFLVKIWTAETSAITVQSDLDCLPIAFTVGKQYCRPWATDLLTPLK